MRESFILIRDLIEEDLGIKNQFSYNYIIWGTKDHIANHTKIQVPN